MADPVDLARALFHPRAIALIGASGDGRKNAGRPQRYLGKHGFAGQLYPVNPYRDAVQGLPAYKTVRDIPGPVDQALIMTPADTVADVLLDCAAAGIRVATIYSDGFAETGAAGEALQKRIVDIAQDHHMRLIGPNSMGVINTRTGMTLSVNAVLEMPELIAGQISVVSQSGTVLGTLLSRGAARGIGFCKLVSLGNEADLGAGEVVDLLVDDPDTDTILLFLEGIRDAGALAAAARRAQQQKKPVLVYKLGKSAAGRQLAVSHSGALASPARTTDAFFRAHGLIPVDMLECLFEMPPLVTGRTPRPGNRVSVITTTGGGAAMVADRLGSQGLELVGPSDALRMRLRQHSIEIGAGPLIDLTMAGTREGVYGAALDVVLADPHSDAVVCVVGSSGQFHPELAVAPILAAAGAEKFVAAFIAPEAAASLARLQAAGIAAFRTPEACADAVAAALAWQAPQPVPELAPLTLPEKSAYTEQDALALFAGLGVPVVACQEITSAEDLRDDMAFPLVAKILSEQIAHKSDAGGVRLGIADKADLARALADIRTAVEAHSPHVRAERFVVQSMQSGIAEVLLGYRRDPEVGPVVILGAGGLLAELLDDVAIAVAPLSLDQARDLIGRVRGLALLQGYRGQPKGDVAALARAIVALSNLAAAGAETIAEAEINPLLVKAEGEGVVALDGLVRLRT